jgi:hypothetical protein
MHHVAKLSREPLVHFLLIGAVVFALSSRAPTGDSPESTPVVEPARTEIVIDPVRLERLIAEYVRQHTVLPGEEEIQALINAWVVDEALYREAMRLQLDVDDEIVRRRMVQKMRFITEGVAALGDPSDLELESYIERNRSTYEIDARYGFSHVFFSRARRGDAAEADCQSFLLGGTDAPAGGDPFVYGNEFDSQRSSNIRARFGGTFVAALALAEKDAWTGPVESNLGYHAVRVVDAALARPAELADVRDRVTTAWRAEERRRRSSEAIADLVARYGYSVEAAQ